MKQRMDYAKAAPGGFNALIGLHTAAHRSGLDSVLMDLVQLRASQINGCAYCIDMHWKDLRQAGVSEQKLYMLTAWREWHEFSEKERAALEWAEAVTKLTNGDISDEVYRIAREQFSEAELANLTYAVVAINGFNRLNVAFRKEAGDYQPGARAAKA